MLNKEADYKRLVMAVSDLNRHYRNEGIWFDKPRNEEDFGLDIDAHKSGLTDNGDKWQYDFKVELKSISTQFGKIYEKGSFYRRKACRNKSFRYGLTGDTKVSQSEIFADTTPQPDWCKTDYPLQVINAADINGNRDNCKESFLFSDRRNLLVFMFENGYLVYDMDDLEEAIVGYAWQRLKHTKELKAIVNLDICTEHIPMKIPEELLEVKDND